MRLFKSIYEKPQPSKDGGLIYLFCEGQNTEPSYFNYFKRKSTNLNLYIVPFPSDGNNSHLGLFKYCVEIIDKDESDYDPKTDLIWLCIDTDDKMDDVEKLKETIQKSGHQINLAQSNRSFEVWLYYHFFEETPEDNVDNWKKHLNDCIPGGFDFRNHPKNAEQAIQNAKKNYSTNERNQPETHCTNIFELVELILSRLKK